MTRPSTAIGIGILAAMAASWPAAPAAAQECLDSQVGAAQESVDLDLLPNWRARHQDAFERTTPLNCVSQSDGGARVYPSKTPPRLFNMLGPRTYFEAFLQVHARELRATNTPGNALDVAGLREAVCTTSGEMCDCRRAPRTLIGCTSGRSRLSVDLMRHGEAARRGPDRP